MLVAVVNDDASGLEGAILDAQSWLEASGAEVAPHGGTRKVTMEVAQGGDVAAALRDACTSLSGPQLLAIGARGSSSLNRAPEFSVSRSVTHHTRLPLLLVPSPHA